MYYNSNKMTLTFQYRIMGKVNIRISYTFYYLYSNTLIMSRMYTYLLSIVIQSQ